MNTDFEDLRAADAPPSGFRPLSARSEVEKAVGPFYERETADGPRQMVFRVTQSKLSANGVCRGGVLASFADIQGTALKHTLGIDASTPTISLNLDFVAPAPAGVWVQSEPRLVRRTRRIPVSHSMIYARDVLCARASGIYWLAGRTSEAPSDP